MGFFSRIRKFFGASDAVEGDADKNVPARVAEQHLEGEGDARTVSPENAPAPESAPAAGKMLPAAMPRSPLMRACRRPNLR